MLAGSDYDDALNRLKEAFAKSDQKEESPADNANVSGEFRASSGNDKKGSGESKLHDALTSANLANLRVLEVRRLQYNEQNGRPNVAERQKVELDYLDAMGVGDEFAALPDDAKAAILKHMDEVSFNPDTESVADGLRFASDPTDSRALQSRKAIKDSENILADQLGFGKDLGEIKQDDKPIKDLADEQMEWTTLLRKNKHTFAKLPERIQLLDAQIQQYSEEAAEKLRAKYFAVHR